MADRIEQIGPGAARGHEHDWERANVHTPYRKAQLRLREGRRSVQRARVHVGELTVTREQLRFAMRDLGDAVSVIAGVLETLARDVHILDERWEQLHGGERRGLDQPASGSAEYRRGRPEGGPEGDRDVAER